MANNNIDVCHCPHLQNISPAPVSWSPPASGRTVCDRTLGWGRADGRVSASSPAQESLLGPRHNTSNTTHLSSFYISEFHKSEAEWFTKKIQTTKIRYYCTNSARIHTFSFVRTHKTHTFELKIPKTSSSLHFDSVSACKIDFLWDQWESLIFGNFAKYTTLLQPSTALFWIDQPNFTIFITHP